MLSRYQSSLTLPRTTHMGWLEPLSVFWSPRHKYKVFHDKPFEEITKTKWNTNEGCLSQWDKCSYTKINAHQMDVLREKASEDPVRKWLPASLERRHQKKQSLDCGLLSFKTRKNKFLLYKMHSPWLVPLSRIRKWKENEEWFYSSSCAINCFRVHGIGLSVGKATENF